MRFLFSAIPDILTEAVCRTVSYFVVLIRPGAEEAVEKGIRGAIIGRRFGGTGCKIARNVLFVGRKSIEFGDKISINAGSQFVAGSRGYIRMGNGSHVSRNSVLAGAGGIEVGEHCKISSGVMIYTVTYDREKGYLLRESPSKHLPVIIGNDVHVGANASILPGVTIGNNAVIGAGAVVAKDVATGETVVGVPAKPINDNHSENRH
ncbi:MAG: acyltransferase [Rhizobiaceae bacterium]